MERRERGFALIVVLWALLMLGLIAVSFTRDLHSQLGGVRLQRERAIADAALDGAVAAAVYALAEPGGPHRPRLDGTPWPVTVGDTAVTVSVRGEAGYIDLNAAADALLQGMFEANRVSPDAAARLVGAIADWRDADDLPRADGAEAPNYRGLGPPSRPRNQPFETVDELRLVAGMTPALYRRVAPLLTVHSKLADIDQRVASAAVLAGRPGLATRPLRRSSSSAGRAPPTRRSAPRRRTCRRSMAARPFASTPRQRAATCVCPAPPASG